MTDKICEDCKVNKADFVVYLEGDEDWTKAYAKYLCKICNNKSGYQSAKIDMWTIDEWERDQD